VDGVFKLLSSDFTNPVNIGNPSEMSILQFAEKIVEFTGSKSKIGFKPLPEDDPKVRQPDITLAKKVLQWEPVVPLDEGLQKTLEYFKTVVKK
jgi:nucleoside-diphosphate-sugar epimerase